MKLVRPQHIEAVEENGSDVIENAKLKVKPYVGYPYIVMAVDEAFYTDNTEKTPSADKKVTPEEESRKNQSGLLVRRDEEGHARSDMGIINAYIQKVNQFGQKVDSAHFLLMVWRIYFQMKQNLME